MSAKFIQLVKEAGVVGAGGAGFPTHVKLDAKADIVIANGAECEPLLQVDQQSAVNNFDSLLAGLEAEMEQVNASKGIIAIKSKHTELVKRIEDGIRGRFNLEVFQLPNVYPAGDEHILVHLVTNKLVPEGGIPLQVGVVVNNVGTIINVNNALKGIPVTERMITIVGEVEFPITTSLPLGTSIREAIDLAGGATVGDFSVIVGGPMMGYVEEDLNKPIIKTTSGIIVLPSEHKLIRLKTQDMKISMLRARSTCCQCNYCTDMCPRRLLGHSIEPHKTIRMTASTALSDNNNATSAFLCSECGLCGYYSCTHEIMPFKVNNFLKRELSNAGIKNPHRRSALKVSGMLEQRMVPTERLLERLGLGKYNKKAAFVETNYIPQKVFIPLKQHIGVAARPVVHVGDLVEKGQMIAQVRGGELGAAVHASINGRVDDMDEAIVIVRE